MKTLSLKITVVALIIVVAFLVWPLVFRAKILTIASTAEAYSAADSPSFTIDSDNVSAIVKDLEGNVVSTITPNITIDGGKSSIALMTNDGFRPGKYILAASYSSAGKIVTVTKEFDWGVLAINTNKSIYTKGDSAYIQMASLTEYGHTLCNSNLELQISKSEFLISKLSTKEGTIKTNPTCGPNNYTDQPDYFAMTKSLDEVGRYTMVLTNLDTKKNITDHFEVLDKPAFDVERVSTTRTNPFLGKPYVMTLKIKANQDFEGTISDSLPKGFELLPGNTTSWRENLRAGDDITLSYAYYAAKISPQLYLIGPLGFDSSLGIRNSTFRETRQWQIASDNACQSNVVTGNWNTAGTWTNCGGLVPQPTDTVEIMAGHTITLNTSPTVAGVTIDATGILTTSQGSAANLTVNGTLTINGKFTVRRSSTTGNGAGQTITVTDLNIAAGASLSADGEGFAAATGPGAGTLNYVGGTHGGVGGCYTAGICNTSATNDSMTNPTGLGSGGKQGVGGGAIIISASGTVTVNGAITANGNAAAGSGAGGTISVTAATLAGTGIIRAKGGANVSYGGGGGGRISLNNVATDNFAGTVSVESDTGNLKGHAGTIYFNSTVRNNLSIGTGDKFTTLTLGSDDADNYTFGTLTIDNGGTLIIDGNPNMNSSNGGSAILIANTLTVNNGGSLNADGMGFNLEEGPGQLGTGSSLTGGTYGGIGGCYNGTCNTAVTYGSISNPVNLGSGGDYGSAGSGGGAVIASVSGTFTVSGTVSAEGVSTNTSGGSGGTVNITAGTLSGSGTISADGGLSTSYGSGGGGRISFNGVTANTFNGTITANGGNQAVNNSANAALPGTVYFDAATRNGTLTIGGAGNLASLILGSDDTNDYTFTNIVVNSGGSLKIGGNTHRNSNNGGAAKLTLTTLTVNSGGTLDANYLGFPAYYGPGSGSTGNLNGGSYGGLGGKHSSATVGPAATYGSITNPINIGSGANYSTGGGGGGGVIIAASGAVLVDGTVSANGNGGGSGAGSGGTVNITAATLTGTGTIQANGGTNSSYGNGGGGRIAIVLSSGNSFGPSFQTYGGSTNEKGAAGTIYLEKASDGSGKGVLIINNNSVATSTSIDTAISSSVTDTSVGSLVLQGAAKFSIRQSQTFSITGTGATVSIASATTASNSGTFNIGGTSFTNSGTFTNYSGSTVNYTGQTDDSTVTLMNPSYYTLGVNNAGTVFNEGGSTTVQTALNVTNGVYSLNGNTLVATGATLTNADTFRLQGAETITNLSANDTAEGTWEYVGRGRSENITLQDFGTTDYYNLKINDSNGTKANYILGNDLSLATGGTLTVNNGILSTTGSNKAISTDFLTINSGGTLLANGSALTIARDWTNNGTFTAGSSTATFNGASASIVSGITSFNNLTVATNDKVMKFAPTSNTTITGLFTITGTSGHNVQLISSTNGSSWFINKQGTSAVTYATVRDGGCNSVSKIIDVSTADSTNAGNNGVCWSFNGATENTRSTTSNITSRGGTKVRGGTKFK